MTDSNIRKVFDYRALRLLVGLIAFAIPICVTLISSVSLSSISASYCSEARNMFVGMLFIVGAFLWAYNGHSTLQSVTSKIASVAAFFVAVFPTACDESITSTSSTIHYVSATVLFVILTYFCLGPFRNKIRGKGGKKGRRSRIYFICGMIMVVCMTGYGISKVALPSDLIIKLRITYWVESVMLFSFGFAWIVAGKYFKLFVEKEDELFFFKK